ncbi:DUF4105 domain-containing protein [Ancylobacter sp. VNQ12]|uniref:Lnb N-terminal periplasmic domain-containing protein n=1 Tax=Ancylobacter sp. VNQ12 TaxID=3400920 RepID=UPI003BFD25C9
MSASADPPKPRGRSTACRAALLLATACLFLWLGTALWFQLSATWNTAGSAAAALAGLTVAVLGWRRPRRGWLALVLVAAGASLWWMSIKPSNERDWAADVAHGVTGEVVGSDVILHNVRHFAWTSEASAIPRWETRRYRLDELRSVDLFSSVWGNPAIAHTLIGFGFADGAYVVFSAEIRRERGEMFSEIGGFFKEFELVMIAADADDIIRLRTDFRGEQVSRFALKLTPEQARALFLSYLARANELAAQPEFYQTVTTNCTTVIFQLARLVEPGIPLDWRILLSGYLPGYLYEHAIIATDRPLEEIKRQAILAPGATLAR